MRAAEVAAPTGVALQKGPAVNRLKNFQTLTGLFTFKILTDEKGNEYILYRSSTIEDLTGIEDKTAFEALENHVHLLDNIKRKEFKPLSAIGSDLAKALLASLKYNFPDKKFVVYVTVHIGEDFIIRFHQQWEGEPIYMNPDDFNSKKDVKVIMLQG